LSMENEVFVFVDNHYAHVEESNDGLQVTCFLQSKAEREMAVMLFTLIISIFGFAVGIRISESLVGQNLFNQLEMTKIGTAYFALVIFLTLLLPKSHLSAWFAIFAPLLLMIVFISLLVKNRSHAFRVALSESLTLIALKMKAGRSFRQSFSEVAAESNPILRAKLSEIGSLVVFSQQNRDEARSDSTKSSDQVLKSIGVADVKVNNFVLEVIEELKRIDRQPHAASRRLNVFRDRLRIEDDFRRRSGQVLARIRAQSMIMTGIYVAMAIFIASKFGWRSNIRIFMVSTILFALGSLWIWRGGRNIKWKV